MARIHHVPESGLDSPKVCGIRTFMRLPHLQTTEDVDFVICGVPFDNGSTFRVGSRFAPEAIRSASVNLRPYHVVYDVNIFEILSGVDFGDVKVVPGYIEDSLEIVTSTLRPIVDARVVPILLGGDHTITLANLRAIAGAYGPVAVIQLDAHNDTWDSYYGHKLTHGTIFRRAVEEGLIRADRSAQVGMRGSMYGSEDLRVGPNLGYEYILGDEIWEKGIPWLVERIRERVKDAPVFLSFDMDFIDPASAPGVGSPEFGGPTTREVLQILRGLREMNFVGFDVVELLPSADSSGVTAALASNIAWEFMALLADHHQRRSPVGLRE